MAILEVHHGGGRVERLTLARDQPLLFGSSPRCDLVLEGPGIAPVHGRIRWRSQRFKIDASPDVGGLEVDGKRVASSSFRQGSEARIGPCRIFMLVDDSPPSRSTGRSSVDKTRVQPAPRVGSRLERGDWLKDLEMAPPSAEIEILDEPRSAAADALAGVRKKRRSRERTPRAVAPSAKPGWLARRLRSIGAEDRPPGDERIAGSPLVLGLLAAIVALTGAGFALRAVIARSTAERQYAKAIDDYEAGDYRNAIRQFELFLANSPEDRRGGKARVMLAMGHVRKFASGAAPSWSNALKEARAALAAVGEEPTFRDTRQDLAELVLAAGEGLAARAAASSDPAPLAESESAIALHDTLAGQAARALRTRSKWPKALAAARTAVAKAGVRAAALAAMDAANKLGDADRTYAARDALVAVYPDLAADRDVNSRLAAANDAIRRSARLDPARRPAEVGARPEPLGPPLSWVVRSEVVPHADPPTPVFAIADGFAFGLDGATGAPLWQVPVGVSSPFPPLAIPGPTPSALVVDARHDELVKLDARTGAIRWRQPLDEPASDAPLVLGDRIYQPIPSGSVMAIDLETGERLATLRLNRPIARTPVANESGRFLYVFGREATLFVLSRDPLGCAGVEYVGHGSGSIPAAPARLGRFLIVPENHAPASSRWRVFVLEADGGQVRPTAGVSIDGWTRSTPTASGSVAWASGDRNGVAAYAIGPPESSTPLTPIAKLASGEVDTGPSFGLARTGREAWFGSGRSARYTLDPERGTLAANWTLADAGPALAPIQVAGELAVLTQRNVDGPGVALWGVDPDPGTVRWRTLLGSPWPIAPVLLADGDRLEAVGLDGRPIPLAADRNAAGGFVEGVLPPPGSFRVAPGSRRIEFDEVDAIVPGPGGDAIHVRDRSPGSAEPRRVPLPASIGAAPIRRGPGLFLPGADGRAYLPDPATGTPLAQPFVPPFDRAGRPAWLAPADLDDGAIALVDAAGKVRRFDRPDGGRARLEPAVEVALDSPPVAAPASTGPALILATADGKIRSLAARDLSPIASDATTAPLAFGPASAGGRVFVADATGGVACYGPDGRRAWAVDLGESPAAGPPAVLDDSAWLLDRTGVLHHLALADGATLDRTALEILPAGGPFAVGGSIVVQSGLGALSVVAPPP